MPLIIYLEDAGPSIKFLWAPCYVQIEGNEKVDVMVRHTGNGFHTSFYNTTTQQSKTLRNHWNKD